VPALLAFLLLRRHRPALLSVLAVLLVLAAVAVTLLHDLTAWIAGHPLTIAAAVVLAAGILTAAAAGRRAR
jgi:drug/metabolite transporter (DMT)-like permease